VTADKRCFMNQDRPCDLTCKAAFEVDDPVDNVDCYFIWLTYHFGESVFELKRVLEGLGGGGGADAGASPGPGFPPYGGGPKKPPDVSKN
jgi:hypothetical protein